MSEERTTYLSCGNIPGSNRKEKPERSAGERYTTDSYRRAIQRACDHAFPPPETLAKQECETETQWNKRLTKDQKEELATWRKAIAGTHINYVITRRPNYEESSVLKQRVSSWGTTAPPSSSLAIIDSRTMV